MQKELAANNHPLYIKKCVLIFLILFIVFFSALIKAQEQKIIDKMSVALNLEQAGEYEKARDVFLELIKANPNDINSLSSLNRIYLKLKDYDSAFRIIEESIKASPLNYNLYGLLGTTYYAVGEIDKAYQSWEKGLTLQPKSAVPYRVIANYAVQNRAYEKAIEYYTRGEKEIGNSDLFVSEVFNLYNALFRYTEAAERLCRVLLVQPEYLSMGKSVMFSYNVKPEMYDTYQKILNSYLIKSGKNVFKEFLAFLYLMKGDDGKAVELIRDVAQYDKNETIVYNFAQECYSYKNYKGAAIAFKYIIDNYRNNSLIMQARILYPQVLELQAGLKKNVKWKSGADVDTADKNEYYAVIKAYEETAKQYPSTEIQNEAFLRKGNIQKEILLQPDSAETSYRKIIANNIPTPTRINAIQNLAEIKLFNNKFTEADNLLNEITESAVADSLAKRKAHYFIGKSFYWRGSFKKALENLDEAAYDFSNDLSNDALELSAVINAGKKDSILLFDYAKADFLVFQRKYGEAEEILKKTALSDNEIIVDAAKYRYAEIMVSQNKYPEAIKIMEEISSSGNSNYADNAYFSLGNIYYYGLNDFRSSKNRFEQLLINFPGSIFADKSREMLNLIKNKLENSNDNQPNK